MLVQRLHSTILQYILMHYVFLHSPLCLPDHDIQTAPSSGVSCSCTLHVKLSLGIPYTDAGGTLIKWVTHTQLLRLPVADLDSCPKYTRDLPRVP